jgi:hypothetical protein
MVGAKQYDTLYGCMHGYLLFASDFRLPISLSRDSRRREDRDVFVLRSAKVGMKKSARRPVRKRIRHSTAGTYQYYYIPHT